MSNQRFYASPHDSFTWPDGTKGYRPGGPFDCLGPFAKVVNCRIDDYHHKGKRVRYTVYATRYPDTYFTIPACCQIHGRYITGYIMVLDGVASFIPAGRFRDFLGKKFPAVMTPESPVRAASRSHAVRAGDSSPSSGADAGSAPLTDSSPNAANAA